MLENYLISIVGKQTFDGDNGEINLTTFGSYRNKDGKQFIAYKEYGDNGQTPVTSVLKIDNNKVEMIHTGDSTRLVLEKGKRHSCQYDTGFGSLMVGVFTSNISSTLGKNGGNLKINYTLDINSSLSSKNEISITVREAKGNV